jgi:hypothetical protein
MLRRAHHGEDMKLTGTTRQAAKEFGYVFDDGRPNVRAFLQAMKRKGVKPDNYKEPRPGEHWRQHHLWWNFSEIQNAFDKKVNISSQSGWRKTLSEALAGGDNRALP